MIVLGVDWGRARAGVAVSDELGRFARPLASLPVSSQEKLSEDIVRLAEREGAGAIVLGLPRNMDGSEGESAAAVRRLAERLSSAGRAVELWDERLTSWEAERLLGAAGPRKRTGEKGAKDRIAACLILQGYLDARRQKGRTGP